VRIALEVEELLKYEEAEPTNSAWLQGGLDRGAEKEKQGFPKRASSSGWSKSPQSMEVRLAAWNLCTATEADDDQKVFLAGLHAAGGPEAFMTWVDQHPWRLRSATDNIQSHLGIYLQVWNVKEALTRNFTWSKASSSAA
jgi:hypothetical protein